MEKTTLTAVTRTVLGRKVKALRRQGVLPANLFGKKVKSLALQIPVKEFMTVYKKVGETGLVELKTEKETYHTLITKLQTDPLTRLPVHAEFHAVSLTEKIKAKVPVELMGESPAVKDGIGLLLQTLNEIEVEALPTDLPEKIEVEVSKLSAVNDQITVGDLPKLKGVEVLTDGGEILVKVAAAVSEEAQKEAEETAAKEAAATEGEAAAKEAPAEGGSDQAPKPEKENS
ncbi:hypothetical protein A2872_00890 [Candidatus Gottesmanbacteria bacterium RIFCSPHIGHO2_01_FULL_42_12]|uniref:Large ribosomal subunit protein bL25 n=1 Tax=Candidatus Gottesmanbacteria bacterium RIFCSPHIGHO2_01_FULL_42_12 TaxID=1798377 RepID=A0A1F5Z326_9BACT|nr:MAG: hypothetical protein A2872_00890 [Candidatus Gottesmanbacteria bacterium RIFCSPHIGHO2_01_FULL_42_12]